MAAVERQIESKRKLADFLSVHESFIYKLLRQKRERGDIAPLPHGGGAQAKLSNEQQQMLPALNRTTEHSYTQAASCESAASELSAVLRASTASVTSGV